RQHRPEDLFAEQSIRRIARLDERRLDEIALITLAAAALDHLRVFLAVVDIAADLVERFLVDDRAHEIAEVADVADLDVLHHRDHAIANVVPARLRHIHAARRGTLLSLEFERAAYRGDGNLLRIGRWVHDDEVLAAGFADET